jgi:hypothetical protein
LLDITQASQDSCAIVIRRYFLGYFRDRQRDVLYVVGVSVAYVRHIANELAAARANQFRFDRKRALLVQNFALEQTQLTHLQPEN